MPTRICEESSHILAASLERAEGAVTVGIFPPIPSVFGGVGVLKNDVEAPQLPLDVLAVLTCAHMG